MSQKSVDPREKGSSMVFNYGQKCAEQIQSQAEKCLGESTKFDHVLKKRTQTHCLHISGTALVVLLLGMVLMILCRRYLKDLLEWLQNLDEWQALFLFLVMFTIVSFPMTWGYIVLNVSAGYLYGFKVGLVVVSVCVTFGFSTAFLVCRRCLRDFVRSKLESDSLKAIMRVVEGKRGFKVIALTRLTPVPFGLQNGLFAVTNVSTLKYIISSTFGLLPTQVLNTYMGSTFRSLEDVVEQKSGGYIILFVQFLISAVLMTYVFRRARKELNRTCDEVDVEAQTNGHVVTALPEPLSNPSTNKQLTSRDVESQMLESATSRAVKFTKGHKRSQSASAVLLEINDETKSLLTL